MTIETVLLAVKQTPKVIQTGDGGVEYLTTDAFGGIPVTPTGSSLPNHDTIELTNNLAGSPTVVVYKLDGATVLTITNTYDGSNFLTSSVRS